MVNWPFVVDILIYKVMICFEDKYRGFDLDFSRLDSGVDMTGVPVGLDWFLSLPDSFKRVLIRIVTKQSNTLEHIGFFYYNVYIIKDKKSFLDISNYLSCRYDFIYFNIPDIFTKIFTPTAHFLNMNAILAAKAAKLYINRALVPYIREYKNVI